MFFQKVIIFMAVLAISITSGGCTKKSPEPSAESVIEITTEEQLLANALDTFNTEDIRGTATIYTTTYEDGATRSETEEIIYHASESLIEKRYTTENDVQKTLYHKDGQDVYCYEDDEEYPDGWVRYLENPDENDETSFDYTLAEFDYSFNEASGYTDVRIKNEGTEMLNGTETIKLSVIATFTPSIDEEEAEDTAVKTKDSVTRKSLLDEFGWSEESIQAVDGFSEILDQYIAYLNDEEIMEINNEEPTEEYLIWIDSESSRIVQLQSSFSVENTSTDLTSDIEEKFWDNSWKVDWIQSDLDDGLTVEEAKEILELEGAYMEEQLEYEDSMDTSDEDVSENGSSAQKVTYIKTFLIGGECPSMTELPSAFTETTSEDYHNAFEE